MLTSSRFITSSTGAKRQRPNSFHHFTIVHNHAIVCVFVMFMLMLMFIFTPIEMYTYRFFSLPTMLLFNQQGKVYAIPFRITYSCNIHIHTQCSLFEMNIYIYIRLVNSQYKSLVEKRKLYMRRVFIRVALSFAISLCFRLSSKR